MVHLFRSRLPADALLARLCCSRSFDHTELSVMQFYTPLTVIVGHNGSGKTVSCPLHAIARVTTR